MRTEFAYRGVEYEVSGWLWSDDGANNGMIVSRADGRKIRGTSIHPGMIQIGRSDALDRAARRALELARVREQAKE